MGSGTSVFDTIKFGVLICIFWETFPLEDVLGQG